MCWSTTYLQEAVDVIEGLDVAAIDKMAQLIANVRERGGRIFFLGNGGGAAHASHAAADFRKLAGIESYAVNDNMAGVTAHTNDSGWGTSADKWLSESRLCGRDLLFVISVGGGDAVHNVSPNIVVAMLCAQACGASVAGIVGRDGGHTAGVADACIVIPSMSTPHVEGIQAVLLHLLVSHPLVAKEKPKWESVQSS